MYKGKDAGDDLIGQIKQTLAPRRCVGLNHGFDQFWLELGGWNEGERAGWGCDEDQYVRS